ncbi:MAG: insulinase family protein [Alphaproteobacteria bacterium]|nr:insulinase family protein [Alphaproteobacteria bacterium]
MHTRKFFASKFVAVTALGLFSSGIAIAADPAAVGWPQATSDIPADPAVKFGRLPNGMRYAILKNETPKGSVSLRLRIDAGSLQESDAQQGLAHFVEHMAFRGSASMPDGDVFKVLERLGLRTGADSNASTGQTQTIYQFDLPKNDEETLDAGFSLTRDIASDIAFRPDDFQAERGPVLSEERLRDGPSSRAFEVQTKFLLRGQLAAERFPIGKVEIIRGAPVTVATDYYRSYYRPERATLVVVGDIDPASIEAKIKARFSSWNVQGPARPDPDFGMPQRRGAEALVFAEAGAPQNVSVSWVTPYDDSPDTIERRSRNRIEALGFSIMNERMARVADETNAPFLSAGAGRGNTARSARITAMRVNYRAGEWRRALIEADKIRRQVLAQGVTQDEVDREVAASLASAEASVAASSTRTSRNLASGIVGAIDRNGVFSSPAEGRALVEAGLKGLIAERVNAALREAFTGNGPLLFLSSVTPIDGGEKTLTEAFQEAESAVIADAVATPLTAWPYTNFGTPGTVVESRVNDEFGATFIRFANGVRLTVKPTKFRADQVLVNVRFAGGRLTLPKDRPMIAMGAYVSGGVAAMSSLDMGRTLATKMYGVGFGMGDDGFSLSGTTRPVDLDNQMQVLAAYVTAPGWRPEPYQQDLSAISDGLKRLETNPMALFRTKLNGLLHAGDARWASATQEDVERARLDDLKAVITPALANGPIEVTMVGDISVDAATKAVAATFGALPQRSDTVPAAAAPGDVRFPAATTEPVVLTHRGRADQGVSFIAWPTTDVFADPAESPARRLLSDILRSRLMDRLRVQDGATYSPSVTASASMTFPGYGYMAAFAELPPDKTKLFYDTVAEVAADLRNNGPTADEIERARKPNIEGLIVAMETNAYWVEGLTGTQTDARRLQLLRDAMPGLARTNEADVQRVARKYLTEEKAWKLLVRPQ